MNSQSMKAEIERLEKLVLDLQKEVFILNAEALKYKHELHHEPVHHKKHKEDD